MPVKTVLDLLLPREKKFLNMLAAQADLLLEASAEYCNFVGHYATLSEAERLECMRHIKGVERKGDLAMREIIDGMHETFITPIDREDMLSISQELEDTLDKIHSASEMVVMYRIKDMPEDMVAFSRMIHDSAAILRRCMHHLKDYKATKEAVGELSRIENESDRLHYKCISRLFDNHHDAAELVKFKDLYSIAEETIDSCKAVGKIVERVVLKHA